MRGAKDWFPRLLPSNIASRSLEVLHIELEWWTVDEETVEEWMSGRNGDHVRALGALFQEQSLKHVLVEVVYHGEYSDEDADESLMQEFEAGFMLHVGPWARQNCKIQIQWATYCPWIRRTIV